MSFTIPGSEPFVSRPVDPAKLLRSLPASLPVHTVGQDVVDALEPLTYEVVRHRVWSITDEMGEALKRMSGSPIVTDANDFDFTINDEVGQVVQVGLYNTMLAGANDLAISWTLLNRVDNPGIRDGDMFLCNDPWVGGGAHQNDTLVFAPLFYDGRLFSWTTAVCHEPDLGGSAIGSSPIDTQDVFAEALPTPPVKVVRDFVLQRDIADLWTRRSRVPLMVGLDLRAKIGANNIGRKRLLTVIDQYGPDTVKAVMKRMMNDAERRLRDKLRSLPDGTWTAVGYQDQAFLGDRKVHKILLRMTKTDDRLVFDFNGTDPQAGVINCTYAGNRGGILQALLPALAGDIPWSAGGLLRCFDIVTPEGTLNNATFPAAINRAPLGSGWTIGNLALDCLSQMLAQKVETRTHARACCCGTWNNAVVAGLDERTETPTPFVHVVMENMAGGYGARPIGDGIDTGGLLSIPMGRVPDAEISELLFPVLMLWRKEEPDSGGPGRYRGGVSASIAMTPHGTSLPAGVILSTAGKAVSQNNGLSGGYPGNTGIDAIFHDIDVKKRMERGVIPTSLGDLGAVTPTQCYAESHLAPGDVLYMHCQGGGGYGDPLHREPQAVLDDLNRDKISPASAASIYGVVTTGGLVDQHATDQRRRELFDERISKAVLPGTGSRKAEVGAGSTVDDNLVRVSERGQAIIACRHCGEVVSEDGSVLHLACLDADASFAGPGVRSNPSLYVDCEIVFRQRLCPSCYTSFYAAIVPADHTVLINGMRVAGGPDAPDRDAQ